MKKFFYSVLAAATMMLAVTSCSEDDPMTPEIGHDGKTQKVTFTVQMPEEEATSRAIADGVSVGKGNMANTLVWALYESSKLNAETPVATKSVTKEKSSNEFKAEIDMVKGLEYTILFFAYNETGTIFDMNNHNGLRSLKYKKDANGNIDVSANQEAYDAFAACHTHTVNDEAVTEVKLYRPFAQINAATTENDLNKARDLSAVVTKTELVIEDVPTEFNILTGEVTNPQEVIYEAATILKNIDADENAHPNEDINVNGQNYKYLTMAYVLAGNQEASESVHNTTFNFYRGTNGDDLVRTFDIDFLPIQRNWRTNVIGDLLTQTESFKVVIEEGFAGNYTNDDILIAAAANGGTISLIEDVTLSEPLEIKEGVNLTINLNGKKIIGEIKNTGTLKLTGNGTIENTVEDGKATINNSGNLVLDGVNIVGAPIGSDEKKYPAYCITNSGNLTIEDGTNISADRGCLYLSGNGETIINGGTFTNNDISSKRNNFTSHVVVIGYGANNKLTINDGTFKHLHTTTSGGVVINNWSAVTVEINGGNFSGGNYFGKWDNLSDYGYGSTKTPFSVKGGTFTGFDNKYLAAGCTATQNADGTITVSGTKVTNLADFSAALQNGASVIELTGNTEIQMPSSGTAGEIKIIGDGQAVIDVTQGAYLENADVTFENLTLKVGTGMVNGNGSDYAALYSPNVTYKNCTFVGPMRIGRDGAKFINCTFTQLGNDYVWTYGNDCVFEGCTFNSDGKAILIYSDGGTEVSEVSVKNCTFNATTGAKAGAIANQNCAAIEIHNYGNGVNLATSNNTVGEYFSGEWRIKTYETGKPKIFVNGTEYTTIALDGKTMTIDANKNVTVN